jgi:acyl-[acyl-carrier-protein]-phospholipid O-acyltransferase/long-chain-fatty-acid--[acyl-carrier-protein] ligase
MSATKAKGELPPKHRSQFRLLTSPRFLPLFLTQALGAFNDNIFKNALVILITYSATTSLEGIDTQTLVALAGGIFILPFFLFSATAGQFADKLAKPDLVRKVKLAEVIIMLVAALGFALNNTILLFTVLFFLGAQSAIFGPLKYGLLPELLEEEELIGGNALIETATFLVILIGTILGGIIVLKAHGLTIISILCVAFALIGWWTALKIPDRPAASPSIKVDFNIIAATFGMVKLAWADLPIFRSIVGISWFWLIGSVFIILFPVFARDVLNGNEQIVAMLLSIFSIGIGIGSLVCDKLLKGKVRDYYVPVGALGITLFSADLFFASQPLLATPKGDFIGVMAFLQAGDNWRIVGDLFGISVCGGLYAVPLYAILQARSAPDIRARLIAANNILNALAMVGASAFIFWLTSEGATVPGIILSIGLLNIPITLYVSFVVISAGVTRVKKRLKALS